MNIYLVTSRVGSISSNLVFKICIDLDKCLVIDDLPSECKSSLDFSKTTELVKKGVLNISKQELSQIDGKYHPTNQPFAPCSLEFFMEKLKITFLVNL